MRRGIVAVAAFVACVVTACSEPRAGTLPPPSPTPSATTTATASPGSPKAELRAAIAQYYETLTAAAHDPATRTDDLAALIAPGCPCRAVLEVLRDEASRGYRLDYSYSVRDVTIVDARTGDALYVVVQTPGHRLDRDGRVIESYPGSTQRFSARFVKQGDRWLLQRANEVRR